MTPKEFLNGFQSEVKVDKNLSPIKTENALYFINKAVTKFVDKHKKSIRSSGDPDSWDNLRTIIYEHQFVNDASNTELTSADGFDEALEADLSTLSDSYLHYLSSRTQLSDGSSSTGERVNNKIVGPEEFNQYSHQRNDKPIFDEFPVVVTGNKIKILPSYDMKDRFGPEITRVWLMYIGEPNEISVSPKVGCDLPTHTHENIVDIALQIMRRNIPSQSKE